VVSRGRNRARLSQKAPLGSLRRGHNVVFDRELFVFGVPVLVSVMLGSFIGMMPSMCGVTVRSMGVMRALL